MEASESEYDSPESVPHRDSVLRCIGCDVGIFSSCGAASTDEALFCRDMALDDTHIKVNRFPRAVWYYRRVCRVLKRELFCYQFDGETMANKRTLQKCGSGC